MDVKVYCMSDNVSTVFISKYFLQYMSLCILRAGWIIIQKFVTQSRTGLQIYEGHDDQLNRPGPMA
jgi:hypothetical protein